MSDRLTRFRGYMAHLDAAADPRHAIDRGLFVARPLRKGRSLFEEITGRLELHPGSSHLVLGGIGSGKTTQLLMAEKRLAERSDCTAVYVDVSLHQDISKLRPQALLALARQRLVERLDMQSQTAPGTLDAVEPAVSLKQVHDRLATSTPHVVLLWDSLDRIVDPTEFENAVADDLAILRKLGIGVVMVGPVALLYGMHRPITGRFDQLHLVTTPDPYYAEEREFLLRMLNARVPAGLLSAEGSERLVRLSGGVLRDLVGIARNAGEEAYLSGEESIREGHVDAAGEEFGRTLLLGLDPGELAMLQAVRTQGRFIPTTDKDLALLMTGRIREYRSGRAVRYVVHPTIERLQLAKEP